MWDNIILTSTTDSLNLKRIIWYALFHADNLILSTVIAGFSGPRY